MATGFTWIREPEILADNLDEYLDKVLDAIEYIAIYFEPILESFAKDFAIWTDWTGNARQGLFSTHEVAAEVVFLYLSHGVDYGVFLELCHGGWYAIIMETLEIHYPDIEIMLQRIFG